MFKKILLPVELTPRDSVVVEMALDLARRDRAAIHLIHVIETIRGVPFEDLEDFYSGLEEKAREAMMLLYEPISAEGLSVSQTIVYGSRPRQIVHHADKEEVDLIILGGRAIDPEQPEAIWNSVGQQVAVLANRSVLLVR